MIESITKQKDQSVYTNVCQIQIQIQIQIFYCLLNINVLQALHTSLKYSIWANLFTYIQDFFQNWYNFTRCCYVGRHFFHIHNELLKGIRLGISKDCTPLSHQIRVFTNHQIMIFISNTVIAVHT